MESFVGREDKMGGFDGKSNHQPIEPLPPVPSVDSDPQGFSPSIPRHPIQMSKCQDKRLGMDRVKFKSGRCSKGQRTTVKQRLTSLKSLSKFLLRPDPLSPGEVSPTDDHRRFRGGPETMQSVRPNGLPDFWNLLIGKPAEVSHSVQIQSIPNRSSTKGLDSKFVNSESSSSLELMLKNALTKQSSSDLSRAKFESLTSDQHGSMLKTPHSLIKVMQKHRDKERYRHRGLNANIDGLFSRLPERQAKAKDETKIMKLRQVIDYICHMEKYILVLCDELGLDLDFKQIFLSPNINVPQMLEVSLPQTGVCLASNAFAKQKQNEPESSKVCEKQLVGDIASCLKSSTRNTGSLAEDFISKNAWELLGFFDNDELPASVHQLLETQDSSRTLLDNRELLPSDKPHDLWVLCDSVPIGKSQEQQIMDNILFYDPGCLDSATNDHQPPSSSPVEKADDVFQTIDVNILQSFLHDENQSSVDKKSNVQHIGDQNLNQTLDCKEKKVSSKQTKKGRGINNENKPSLHKMSNSRSHQASSWLNGFMAYSQEHRQNYLRANVGLRNSRVSKLMASDWKKMDPSEKLSYRDKARILPESLNQI